MKRLENKDISLVHSMIPLVSDSWRHSELIFRHLPGSQTFCFLILGLLHHEAEQFLRAHGESFGFSGQYWWTCSQMTSVCKQLNYLNIYATTFCFSNAWEKAVVKTELSLSSASAADHLEGVRQHSPLRASGSGGRLPEALQATGEGSLWGDRLW